MAKSARDFYYWFSDSLSGAIGRYASAALLMISAIDILRIIGEEFFFFNFSLQFENRLRLTMGYFNCSYNYLTLSFHHWQYRTKLDKYK